MKSSRYIGYFGIMFLILSCDESPTEPQVIHGCMDSQSCNYNPNSTHDNNSCLELDECGECGGDNLTCIDECGVPNGDNSTCTDECGVIYGSGYDCGGSCNEENIELWGNCYNIETTTSITLINNQIYGQIPSVLSNLTNLKNLNLRNNGLSGEIPISLSNLVNLEYLNLENNQLTGQITSIIGNLTNLEELHSYDNQLTGEIPSEICDSGDSFLSVGNNKLCPEYPSCISQSDIDSQDTSNCP